MRRFKNILLVVDQDIECAGAIEQAMALAERNQARITVVEAIELPARFRAIDVAMPSVDLHKLVIEKKRESLDELLASFLREGVDVVVSILPGVPYVTIIQEVLRSAHDLVITTAEGKGRLEEWAFGSTSLNLLRKCPCPVWIMKPHQQSKHNRILAAVAPPDADDEEDGLDSKIMDLATSLARQDDCELHIVHVWSLYREEDVRRNCQPYYQDQIDTWAENVRDAHEQWLADLTSGYDLNDVTCHSHFLKGEARSVIPAVALEQECDLIVMGTTGRTGLSGFFIGNTAETVLQQISCSVLTVKPDQFTTPITLDS